MPVSMPRTTSSWRLAVSPVGRMPYLLVVDAPPPSRKVRKLACFEPDLPWPGGVSHIVDGEACYCKRTGGSVDSGI